MNKYLIFIVLCFSCTTNYLTNHEHDKLGISIYSDDFGSDSTTTIFVELNRLVDTLPLISINGNSPDTPYFQPNYFIFSNIKFDTTFTLSIKYKNDSVGEIVYLPGLIDSLFINGIYISNNSVDFNYKLPENTDSLSFNWKDANRSKYYCVNLFTGIGKFNPPYRIITDTSLKFFIDWNNTNYNGTTVIDIRKTNNINLNDQPKATIISNEMFIYLDIRGPRYHAQRDIVKQII